MTRPLPPKSVVLYADDDPDDIDLVREAFAERAQNIELLTFADGVGLLNHIQNDDPFQPIPCLVILDINMPRLNGMETLRRLRKVAGFDDVPVVLFSTSTLPSDAQAAKSHNAGFVTKPLLARQIHLILDQIIEHCSDEVRKRIRREHEK